MLFAHWTLIASLIKVGMSYREILGLSESELTYLFATLAAMSEKEDKDMEARNRH
tara:strand:- start:217 stop:381 length:165 start_codon:yes stop_codon:yes gene_type:complete